MKLLEIIILIVAAIAGIVILIAVTGKKAVSGLPSLDNLLGSNATPGTLEAAAATVTAVQNHTDSSVGYSGSKSLSPGTYVTAGTLQNPLAFTVVGGVDNRPATGRLFGNQSGYGGITASKEGAGASGSRPGGTGTWTSSGYVTKY